MAYEHVGVLCCLYESDLSGVEERLSRARRALNAVPGLGIRKNGLTVATCCTIFWAVVVPIAPFGSELWILSDRCVDLIETFQGYAGKRVQLLFNLVPNSGAFFSLGWLRLVRLVEVKKLLFVRAILVLDVTEPSRRVFCRRFEDYMDAPVTSRENVYGSVVFDLVNVAVLFGLLDDVCNMVAFGLYVVKRCVEKQSVEESVGDGCLLLVCGS